MKPGPQPTLSAREIVYEADPAKAIGLIKAGFDVRDPRAVLARRQREQGKIAREVLYERGYLKSPDKKGEGFVYIFAAGAHVKVGISQFDVDARWWTIRSNNPLLEPALFVSSPLGALARSIEQAAHKQLMPYHVSGEWFSCDRSHAIVVVKKLIEDVPNG